MENRTSELRKELGAQKRMKNDLSMNSLGIQSAANTFSQRSRSVLPPIRSERGSDANDISKASASPQNFKSPYARKGSLDRAGIQNFDIKNRLDTYSESRSVYKLDPQANNSEHGHSSPGGNNSYLIHQRPTVPGQGPSLDQLFRRIGVEDKGLILDKIHTMRMRAFEKRGQGDNMAKLNMPTFNDQEKLKLIEQYQAAKREMRDGPDSASQAAGRSPPIIGAGLKRV